MNFDLIKQCLSKMQDMDNKINQDKIDRELFSKEIY